MDGVLFVESDPVRNDGVDAHRARGVSLFRPRQQQQQWFHAFSCGLWRKVSRLRLPGDATPDKCRRILLLLGRPGELTQPKAYGSDAPLLASVLQAASSTLGVRSTWGWVRGLEGLG